MASPGPTPAGDRTGLGAVPQELRNERTATVSRRDPFPLDGEGRAVEPSAQRARVRTQHLPHNRKRPSDQPKSLGGGGVSATQVALDIAAASLGVSVVSVAAAAR